ncbi:MAG: hypothetical protein ACHQ5A_15540, partial [Opitutales bacterium]
MLTEIFFDAARECEGRFHSLHIQSLNVEGDLVLDVDAGQNHDVPAFGRCYWQGIGQRVERRHQAGLPVPNSLNLKPPVDY